MRQVAVQDCFMRLDTDGSQTSPSAKAMTCRSRLTAPVYRFVVAVVTPRCCPSDTRTSSQIRMHMRSSLLLVAVATISLSSIAFAAAADAAATGPSASSTARRLAFLGSARRAAFWLGRSSSTTNTNTSTSTSTSMSSVQDSRILDSPSAQRNKDPILSILKSQVVPLLLRDGDASKKAPPSLTVLEVAAGCGVHTLHFARGLVTSVSANEGGDGEKVGSCTWYPTDPSATSRESIDARVAAAAALASDDDESSLPSTVTIRPAQSLTLDADGIIEGRSTDGGLSSLPNPTADIGPSSLDLITNINMIHISPWTATLGLMKTSSELLRPGGILYCYGPYKVNGTAVESNLNFDQSLKSRDASWGVRDLEEVIKEAERRGLRHVQTVEMPANNLSVIYQKL